MSGSTEEQALAPILESLRAKLLDLTTRNRLLAFNHTRTGCLRVVDELPDQLFQGLRDGRDFGFAPVPEPSRHELEAYHRADGQVPRAPDPAGRLPLPKAEIWASHCGIEAGYELPIDQGAERPERHSDRTIQTLLYPDEMEKRLRKLRSDARTAVEETGSNLLHLAFGFLEWREPRVERSHLAPLILLPVELERRLERGGRHLYRLSYSGEDLQSNLSLEKKLAESFGLALPPLGEEETPEGYFRAVRLLVEGLEGWRVRRSVTLALFQFGKQLLYRDLDPAVWPAGQGLARSPLLGRLLLGEGTEGGGIAFGQAPVEPSPEDIDLALELVDRSDSSQSAALLRALSGESLVIQGPPGTGKSQTITNLIAAALARGKSLLFVSEKLAALEVVRRRLDDAGLGDFVLELHSHKTRRQALIEDLRERFTAAERRRPPRAIERQRRDLAEQRGALQAYVQAVASPHGALGWPVSSILFQAGRIYRRLGEAAHGGLEAPDLEPAAVNERERSQALTLLAEMAVLAAACPEPRLALHPWAGLSSERVIGEADRRLAVRGARAWREALASFEAAAEPLRRELALPPESDLVALAGLCEKGEALLDLRARLTAAAPLARRIAGLLGQPDAGDSATLTAAAAALRLAAEAPRRTSPVPEAALEEAGAELCAGYARRLSKLQDQRGRLGQVFALPPERLGEPARLRHLAGVLEDAGLFSWLSGAVRAARREVRGLSRPGTRPAGQAMELRSAAKFLEEQEALLDRAEGQGLAAGSLEALAASLAAAEALRAWHGQLDACFGRGLAARAGWGSALRGTAAADLSDLAAAARDPGGQALLSLEEELATLPDAADPWFALLAQRVPEEQARALAGLDGARFADLLRRLPELTALRDAALSAEVDFAGRVGLESALWDREGQSPAQRLDLALAAEERLLQWLEIDALRRGDLPAGVTALAEAVLRGDLPADQAASLYDHLLFDGLARSALADFPAIRRLRAGDQDRLREAFRGTDEALMQANAEEIAARLARAKVPAGRSGARVGELTEWQLLSHELGKQKRHIPIRQLLRRAGKALQAMKPCFMMGPQSVAQYLEPGRLHFDLVIFDEASQVRPEEAIGAIARGSQVVIVGDTRQLPPTSFFQRTGEVELGEDTPLAAEQESILEMAEQRLAAVMLRWHYRSLHPDLIAFSNARFYDGRLLLFPSASRESADSGLSFERVAEGCFEDRRNRPEAEIVATAAVQHLLERPSQSLGIVAMNVEQRDLIAELVERRIDEEPQLARLQVDEERQSEPFFVKNLENVQGDERDVIMISMTYGPPEPGGRVAQRFGPINQDNGWRRLNVLFSRAKQRMRVFSSMDAGDVAPGEGSGRGLVELKSFLAYAQTGILEGPARPSPRPVGSDFEQAVIEGLEQQGFDCRPQIGQAGFFIDIGVVDPEKPDRYLAGIECDGANYHSSPSARDRDHLRQAVLERLGWNILRVWSTDWFRDPEATLARLVTRLEALRRSGGEVEAAPPVEPVGVEGDPAEAPVQPPLPGLTLEQESLPPDRLLPEVLSERDARSRLVALREEIQAGNPEHDRATGLLRKSMLDELLRKRPGDAEAFRRLVRRDLREATNGEDLRLYGPRVFDILERIA